MAAGGCGKDAPFPKLRSVEILDLSSLPNPEWTYGKIWKHISLLKYITVKGAN